MKKHATANSEPAIKLENISFSYNNTSVLDDVNLSVLENEFIWIVGPNGGGKTTLMKIMLGLLRPRTGHVKIFGSPVTQSLHRIGYVPQHAHLDRRFPITVMEVALMGRLTGGPNAGSYSASDRKSAMQALELLDISGLARLSLHELSGGQQRRLLIARALAAEPDLLLLDEPTANLDRQIEAELFDIFRELNSRLTIVMVSHDPAFVSDFVEHVVCVNRTVAVHPTAIMDRQFIGELYGTQVRMVRHDLHNNNRD